ncbi:MAG: electron transfer flavoprotein subunit beta [Firmicutes bacterium HGW-Firmicutes-12]|nr:MAG: electron transfer flavoprotein subunit beta [Firmicutes bacterium HGW-Firmicutes-12]
MKIIVCAKQVPDTTEVKIDKVKNTLIRDSAPSIMNYEDENALEEALRIKEQFPDSYITVISMGPPQAKDMLEECIAQGADEAILISDRELVGSDTWATSNVLAAGIRKLSGFDLILTGRQAIDGDTAQVGPQLAEKLGIPQVTYVKEVTVNDNEIIAKRTLENGYETLKLKTPCLLTVTRELNQPRYMTIKGIYNVKNQEIKVWNIKDINVDLTEVGLDASPTKVVESFVPTSKGKGTVIEADSAKEKVAILLEKLKEKHI